MVKVSARVVDQRTRGNIRYENQLIRDAIVHFANNDLDVMEVKMPTGFVESIGRKRLGAMVANKLLADKRQYRDIANDKLERTQSFTTVDCRVFLYVKGE